MEVARTAVALIISILIVATSHNNGYVEASTQAMETTTKAPADGSEFHVIMIIMIVLVGFILVFSICCGLLTVCGIDIDCPLPCCGNGANKQKNSGIPHKQSSRAHRSQSSQHLNDSDTFHEVELKPKITYGGSMSTGYGGSVNPGYGGPVNTGYEHLGDFDKPQYYEEIEADDNAISIQL